MYKFRLFISGFSSATSQIVIEQVKTIMDDNFPGNYTLSIVDVIDDPECARSKMIFATPVLVKHFPKPERRIFGSFIDPKKVLKNLGLTNKK